MTETIERLEARLRAYAGTINVNEIEVFSLKLRPVMPGVHPHESEFQHCNAYMYSSEYQVGKSACNLGAIASPIAATNLYIRYPHPWSSNKNDFVLCFKDVDPPAVWVQHETGLEILCTASTIATLILTIFQIYEKIRKKVSANAKAKKTDRYHKRVHQIRVEVRKFDKHGNLQQELIVCQDVHQPFNKSDFANKIQNVSTSHKSETRCKS